MSGSPQQRLLVLTALQKALTAALADAKRDVLDHMDEGDRKAVIVGDDALGSVTFTRGSVTVEVTSVGDLVAWCRENVPDAVVTTRSLTPGARIRAEAAYLKTAAAHEVVDRVGVDQVYLDRFLADAKAGEVFPGITRTKGRGHLTVSQKPAEQAAVARLAREGAVSYELEAGGA